MNFKNETNWVVITGAPCSGKTSVINALAERKFTTQPETARAVIAAQLQAGKTLDEIRADGPGLQREILRVKQELEAHLDHQQLVFLDRGIPDSLTYFRMAGADLDLPHQAVQKHHYRAVFIFDRLPVIQDEVRNEDEDTAHRIDVDIEKDYAAVGYMPIRVPVMPIEARANFVLKTLGIES